MLYEVMGGLFRMAVHSEAGPPVDVRINNLRILQVDY